MTLIDDHGACIFRPHPGLDLNGWGSSLYFQPFLPGAVLKGTVIGLDGITIMDDHVQVSVNGTVSRGTDATYGTWQLTLLFAYDESAKRLTATGTYTVTLAGALSASTGDLNLLKIASNYLDDVPLLSGGMGDTGDMEKADVTGDAFSFTWVPENQPAHFPTDTTDMLTIDVKGQYNQVDTEAQGYGFAIAAAYKPSLKVSLASHTSGIPMVFGGIYDVAQAQDFSADNVGITPLVLKRSPDQQFDFDVTFDSEALPGDPGP